MNWREKLILTMGFCTTFVFAAVLVWGTIILVAFMVGSIL